MQILKFIKIFFLSVTLIITATTKISVAEEENISFRIGTGSSGGAGFELGGIIAGILSNPIGSRDCGWGGSCGVSGMIATAIASYGAVANSAGLIADEIDASLIQSDVAKDAYFGKGVFFRPEGKNIPVNLRVIARTHLETMHIVASKKTKILKLKDIIGKRFSLGARGSGTLETTRKILSFNGIKEQDFIPFYFNHLNAVSALEKDEIDGFFIVDAVPVPAIEYLASQNKINLISLDEDEINKILKADNVYKKTLIPSSTYNEFTKVETIAVDALLVVNNQKSDDLIYRITKALWNKENRRKIEGFQRNVELSSAVGKYGILFHSGAKKFYDEEAKK